MGKNLFSSQSTKGTALPTLLMSYIVKSKLILTRTWSFEKLYWQKYVWFLKFYGQIHSFSDWRVIILKGWIRGKSIFDTRFLRFWILICILERFRKILEILEMFWLRLPWDFEDYIDISRFFQDFTGSKDLAPTKLG